MPSLITYSTPWFGSQLYSLAMPAFETPLPPFVLSSPHFVCLVAADGGQVSSADIVTLADALLQRGLACLCAWGPDCERVHDLFDYAEIERNVRDNRERPVVLTTAHPDESLDEALWFMLNGAQATPAYEPTCRARLALTVGNASWAAQVHRCLDAPDTFDRDMLEALGRGDL